MSPHLNIKGVIDWQHSSILPLFLAAGIPSELQNHEDAVSRSMVLPSLPENIQDLGEDQQGREHELLRRRLIHYHYVAETQNLNKPHYKALTDPVGMLRRRLFRYSADPWEGETLQLKMSLIQAVSRWEMLTGASTTSSAPPCPITFDPEDVQRTRSLETEQIEAHEQLEACREIIGFAGQEGWVPAERHEEAMKRSVSLKESAMASAAGLPADERARILEHWPFDDMDETEY